MERNIYYWYLSGKQKPNFRTINSFRTRHFKQLRGIFSDVVRICMNLGIGSIILTAIDGTKIKANASREKFRDHEWLEKKIKDETNRMTRAFEESDRIDREEDKIYGPDGRGDEIPEELADVEKRLKKIRALKEELSKKKLKRINETDNECRIMKAAGNHYIPAYNCQAIVDVNSQLILVADVINKVNDCGQIPEQLETLIKEYSVKPKIILGDSGYWDGENLNYLNDMKIDGIIADKTMKEISHERRGLTNERNKYKKIHFRYIHEKDTYMCPEGKELHRQGKKGLVAKRKNIGDNRYYTYTCRDYHECKVKIACSKNKRHRKIYRYFDEDIRELAQQRIRSNEGYTIYKQRMTSIEPVFGNIKHNLGFNSFHLRGMIKTRGEFLLVATAHNLKKLSKQLNERE
jgi:hypothetical protein